MGFDLYQAQNWKKVGSLAPGKNFSRAFFIVFCQGD